MDEPLSNLDAKLRVAMRTEISKLHKRLNTTFVYVTHDQTEAMTMGTRIVVMKDGVIQQVDSPTVLYNSPCNMFVAGFIGSPQMNFMDAVIEKKDDKLYVKIGKVELPIPADKAAVVEEKGYAGKEVVFGIRPENIDDAPAFVEKHAASCMEAKVELVEHMGSETFLYLVVEGNNIVAKVEPTTTAAIDDVVKVGVDMNLMHLFDKETENTII